MPEGSVITHSSHAQLDTTYFVKLASLLCCGIGILCLCGWYFNIEYLKSVLIGAATMKPNTAICFILAGTTLWLRYVPPLSLSDKLSQIITLFCIALIGVIGLVTIYEYAFASDIGIDTLLFPDITKSGYDIQAGRMAPATATAFVFFAMGLYSACSPRKSIRLLGQACAWVVLLIGLLSMLGYAYGMEALYHIYTFSSVALHTALLFSVGGLGLLLARTDFGFARIITSPYSGGRMARQILPLAVSASFLIGYLRLQGEIKGHFSTEFGVAIFTCSTVAIYILLVAYGARAANAVEQSLRVSEERLRLALDAAHMGSFDVDMRVMKLTWSPVHEALWGFSPGEFDGSYAAFANRVHPNDLPLLESEINRCIETQDPFIFEFRVVWPDESIHWIASHGEFTFSSDNKPLRLHGVAVEITERKAAEVRLNYLANHDDLTGLPNRILFYDRMQQAIIDAERNQRLVAVVFLDLDRFKNINDSLGHETGDALLRSVSERLLGTVRRGDTVARLGGDEFTLVLAGILHVDEAARIAQKILDVFAQPFYVDGYELFVGASMGLTICPDDSRVVSELLRFADIAMYRAKEVGRNNFQFYAAEMTIKATDALTLENELRHGLENNEFILHYQPIIDRHGYCIGVEALIRWRHVLRGLVTPADFIPLAEETGIILQIGNWVVREACNQIQAWRRMTTDTFHIAINVSPRQFRQENLEESIDAILQNAGLGHDALDIEITEGILMQQDLRVQEILARLGKQGLKISIDDFGTGYSNLSYLKKFPVNYLKIDQSFIRDVTTDPNDAALVKAIINMAHSLGLQTIAEGVETVGQHRFLIDHDCDAMQGYYYCRPQSAQKISAFLDSRELVSM